MKKIIILFIATIAIAAKAQTLSPAMVNTMGGSGIANSIYFDYTVGEPYVQFGGTSCDSIFAGFQHCAIDTLRIKQFSPVVAGGSGATTVCYGNAVNLTAPASASYTWSNGQNTASINATVSGVYTASVTNSCGNIMTSNSVSVTVLTPQIPQICMVSTEAVSNYNYNYIYWEKAGLQKVDSFIVYRYDAILNNYLRIGATHRDSTYLKDTTRYVGSGPGNNGDPNLTQWKYKLVLRDSCGNFSDINLTKWHLTEHLTMNVVGGTTAQFNVIPYQIESNATLPTGYAIYKDDNNTGNYALFTGLSGTSASDASFGTTPQANYRVDILGFNCNVNNPLAKINPNGLVTSAIKPSAISNKVPGGASIIVTAVDNFTKNSNYTIFPNPSNNLFTISSNIEIGKLEVYNALNQLIYSTTTKNKTTVIDLTSQSIGVYYLHTTKGVQKLIKQ